MLEWELRTVAWSNTFKVRVVTVAFHSKILQAGMLEYSSTINPDMLKDAGLANQYKNVCVSTCLFHMAVHR